jgi:colanic acid biosynthesis glycosyl transferase WcaI
MTQWFEPEPAFKGLSFARALRDQGCDIRVVTGFPNYPRGKLYPGHRLRAFRRQRIDDVVVDRIFLYPSHSRSWSGRALNYLSFAFSLTVYGLLARDRRDVIYVYHPPLTAALAAVVVGFVRRIPIVVDIQDLWPDALSATDMVPSRWIVAVIDRACGIVYRRARRIIVQSHGFKQRLIARGVPADKIAVILNWAPEQEAVRTGKLDLAPYAFADRFNVVFAGTMGMAQGLDVVLDAAKLVADATPGVQFVLVGDGVETTRLQRRVVHECLGNVRIMPRVALNEVADILCAADVLLVTLRSDPLFEITIPSKTQFYLCIGKPVLMAVGGEAASLIEQAKSGVCVPPSCPAALAEAVLRLKRAEPAELAAMGQRGRAYYREQLSFASAMKKTLAVLGEAMRRSTA